MSKPLEARGLSRAFGKGESRVPAVTHVSLAVAVGQIVCVLGPNGAGKTTTVRMCSTMLEPDAGSIAVDGIDAIARPQEARRHLGLSLGGESGFYPRASVRDNLLFFADVAGLGTRQRRSRVAELIAVVGLADKSSTKFNELSRGMKQRMHIARSLLRNPPLLLLDEPTNGLDPEQAISVRQLIRDLAADGTGILLTSHYLAEAELLADHLVVIDRGEVRAEGSLSDLAALSGLRAISTFSSAASLAAVDLALKGLKGSPGTDAQQLHGRTHVKLTWSSDHFRADFDKWLKSDLGRTSTDVVHRQPTLEEIYLDLVGLKSEEGN